MRKTVLIVNAAFLCLFFLGSIPFAAAQQPSADVLEMQVLELTNRERTSRGLAPLRWNTTLASAARAHSRDMAVRNYFSHSTPEGLSPFDRMTRAGYSYTKAAENIAQGQRTAEAVVQSWMNSSGHRANILDSGLTELGVGFHNYYWTQKFGTPRQNTGAMQNTQPDIIRNDTPPTPRPNGSLSGAYNYGSNYSITFNGNNFTLRAEETTITGTYSVSGATLTLAGHNRTEGWIRGNWTVVDANTLRDPDGDTWRKSGSLPSGITLSGTYSFNPCYSITFSGNNFTIMADGIIFSGTYSVSGATLTLAGHNRTESWMRGNWTVVDANTLQDADCDLWSK